MPSKKNNNYHYNLLVTTNSTRSYLLASTLRSTTTTTSTTNLNKMLLIFYLIIGLCFNLSNGLYYDGITSYSIYPRLDLQLCANSSLSFDFTVSTSANLYGANYALLNTTLIQNSLNSNSRLLIYSEQQVQVQAGINNKKLINSYFLVKLVNGNRLVVNDYWSINDVSIQLPSDYTTSWFRFVYTRRLTSADISLFKFETSPKTINDQQLLSFKLVPVFSKQVNHANFIFEDFKSDSSQSSSSSSSSTSNKANSVNSDPAQVAYSQLLVGGIGEFSNDRNFSYILLKQLGKFHGYIMNLQYTSYSSQCDSNDICSKSSSLSNQRQYALFSSSKSKQYKLQKYVDRDSLLIDDICESDTLTHDICPKDCSCLSNNFQAPYFNCDCSDATLNLNNNNNLNKIQQCTMLFKSFAINLDDTNHFGNNLEKFEYPILSSFSKIAVQNLATQFDKTKGVQFKSSASHLYLMPTADILESDACFWNIDDCVFGFSQYMIMSIDRLDEKKVNNKVIIFVNGQERASKFVAYIYKNRLHFSIYEYDSNVEWLVSSPLLDKNYINRQIKLTITWLRDKHFSLHFDGFLVDMITRPLASPLNQDIYSNPNNLNKFLYEYGTKLLISSMEPLNAKSIQLERMVASTISNHQFTIKYIRRDYYNDLDGQDSKIIVSSPLPSEVIRIDNTQRVMYKIDSPLTGVTTETIELSFKTSQADGVIFYIKNNPIISYFELVRGQPVAVIDTRFKNVHLRPQTAPLNDNDWHEVKLHRDGQTISINIDSQYHDSSDLGQSNGQILTGGYVYLGLADPNNINLSNKKAFVGEMVRGKVTINNVQQKVVQQPYYWPSMPAITTNQTVNIDTSQLAHDGKMINIIINVYGPPGINVNTPKSEADTHYIYLDNLPDTRHISVGTSDREIDFRVGGVRLEGFLIKFQTRQSCGQLITLINDPLNYIGLEIYDGYLYSSTSISGSAQRSQISRVRVDDGRIYQVNMKQEQQKLLCWLDVDDSYKQQIMYVGQSPTINTVRVAGHDGSDFGFSSRYSFVGCIGAIILNDRDVIDYKFVSTERRQSCQEVITPPATPPPPPTTPAPAPPPTTTSTPIFSLGYISFSGTVDILAYNYFYDHEKPCFEDISFIFRTVVSSGILFSAHNDESHNPHLIGAYIKEGLVHVVYLNSSYTQDLYFEHTTVDDGNLYRLNIRRNSYGQGFIQLQSYESVKAIEFYTQPGVIKFTKILVGGADDWGRVRFFGTRQDFVGCIIDLFQINGNSVIKPAEIPKERYNCNVERPRPVITTTATTTTSRPECLPEGYPISFNSVDDAFTHQHETRVCEHIHIPFRTREPRGIIYSHSSEDGRYFIIVYLRRGVLNIIVRDAQGERDLELDTRRVDDGELHKLDIHCESNYLIAYIDQDRQATSKRIELYSPLYLNSYTLGYYNERLSPKHSILDHFRGCLEQVLFNKECLVFESSVDRNRLTCSVEPMTTVETTTTITTRRISCINTCYNGDNQCVIELSSRGYLVYNARELETPPTANGFRDSIRLTFQMTDLFDQDQELFTVYGSERSLRLYFSAGQIYFDDGVQRVPLSQVYYNDGKWHRLVLEQNGRDLTIKIDETSNTLNMPFDFSLYGDGRIYFGASLGGDANNFHGLIKDVYVKYSHIEYDVMAAAKDSRIPGAICEGHVLIKSYVEPPKLKCVSDPVVDGSNECATDGVCYASLWRNSSGTIERYMRCFNREQLQPPDNPVLCRSQDPTRYVIKCCDTDYCNRDLNLTLKDIDKKDERSIWRFRGLNSGDIEFVPHCLPGQTSELIFHFNTSKPDGNIMCTRDETLALKAELKDSNLLISVSDAKSRRVLKTAICQPNPGEQFIDNKWHKVHLVKRSRSQIVITCDDGQSQSLQYDADIPFVNTNYGVSFGIDCINDKGKKFNGDLSQITYINDQFSYSFDDLQYSEDPRFTYEGYVEFRPKYITEVYSDPKPILFRSKLSSARISRWNDPKVGPISFDFKTEINDENGYLFSTESIGSYFALVINDGYLESILSPHRVPNADSSSSVKFYDRFQRLSPFPKTKVNDGNWHKLEFMMIGDSVGAFSLDEEPSGKIKFPFNYWNEDSSIVFGNNLDIQRDLKTDFTGSFRGCIKNIVINNRLIDWSNKGSLFNIEAGCYSYKFASNQLFFMQLGNELESASNIHFNGNGCVRYNPESNNGYNERETIEFLFKTNGDRSVIFDSVGSELLVHVQGPGLTIRNKEDTFSRTLLERGIAFNDGNVHKLKLEKSEDKIEIEVDNKYKQDFLLNKRTRLGPFFLGCSRDNKLKTHLIQLQDFDGTLKNVVYTKGEGKLDVAEGLTDANPLLLIDGHVNWNNGVRSSSKGNDEAVTFKDTSSFLRLDGVDFDSNSNISFSFKTNENDGLLGFILPSTSSSSKSPSSPSNYLALELTDGTPSLLISLGNQLKRISCSHTTYPHAVKFNDNKWHTIQIRRNNLGNSEKSSAAPSVTLACDNHFAGAKVSEQQSLPLTLFTAGNLSALPQSHFNLPTELWLSKNPKFVGCIRDFKLNQKSIDVYSASTSESRSSLSKGCQDNLMHCSKFSKCLNQGECVEGFSRTFCNCDAVSYTGPRCESAASTLSFNGSQGVEFLLNDLVKSSSEDVVLRFKTRLRNGVLFALKKTPNEPSLVISLEDGRIKVVYDRDNNDKVIYVGEPNLFNTNKWHTVHVKRNGPNVLCEVIDNERNKYYVVDDLNIKFIHVLYRFIEIGSIVSQSLIQEHPNFIGWIQNVKFNGDELLNYYLNERLPNRPGLVSGNAEVGENSLLLHHQITFTGSCAINLPRITTNERFNIHLFFKTSQPNGVIFFRRGKDLRFLALELNKGILRFVFNLGGGVKVLESPGSVTLHDKKWHEITIKKSDRKQFSMKIDEYKELSIDFGVKNPPLNELESFVVGALNADDQKFFKEILNNHAFIGCLASLEINNDPAYLYSNMLNLCPNVYHGCLDSECYPNPCSNNGKCSIVNGQASCDCEMTSYTGPLCRDDSKFYFFGGESKKCGLIKFSIVPPAYNQETDRLAFGFTTTSPSGLLTKIEGDGGNQFVEIKLKNGIIELSININNVLEIKDYSPPGTEKFNDNRYHVVQFRREKNEIHFKVDNYEALEFTLKGSDGIFHSIQYIYAGALQDSSGSLTDCFYGIMSGMVFSSHYVLDRGVRYGDVVIVEYKYINLSDIETNTRVIPLPPDGFCPLGYNRNSYLCIFIGCPLYSDFLEDYSCRCIFSYYHISNGINECRKINDTPPLAIKEIPSAKFIPAKTMIAETPLGLILGIISGIALALLAAAIGARKCADGLCVPAPPRPKPNPNVANAVGQVITGTTTTISDTYAGSSLAKKEEQQIPLIQKNENFSKSDEYYKENLDFGYNDRYALVQQQQAAPVFTQINETTEMFEQTSAAGAAGYSGAQAYAGATLIPTLQAITVPTVALANITVPIATGYNTATYNTGSMSHSAHHSSHRNLAMDSLFYSQNNGTDYELSNVTCVTMTPNGKYAIIGQSNGTPQIWDTISGQLIRSMNGICSNCSNLVLANNGSLLVGLGSDGTLDDPTKSLQIWEVPTGKPIQMSHQIKCCVFALSADTNSIFMAGNQRFGRGISVGILDLVTNELTKEIKSDPTVSFGDNPESILITPDERHAIVGCRSLTGSTFVIFDITKSTEIANTRSISFDADPKCLQVLNNTEVLTGTRGGHLIQWNIYNCVPTISYEDPVDGKAHRASINQISLSSDNEFLVTASSDLTAKVWNTKSKSLVSVLSGHGGEIICASISNNDLVVTGSTDQTIGLWRLYNGSQISTMSVGMNLVEVQMARHNKTIVAIGEKDGEQQLLMLRVINVQR